MRDGAPGEGISTAFPQQLLMQNHSISTKLLLRAKITALAITLTLLRADLSICLQIPDFLI